MIRLTMFSTNTSVIISEYLITLCPSLVTDYRITLHSDLCGSSLVISTSKWNNCKALTLVIIIDRVLLHSSKCKCKCTGLFLGLISIQHLHPTSDIYTPGIGTLTEISLISLGRIHGASFVPEELPILSHSFCLQSFHQVPITAGWPGRVFQLCVRRESNP